MAQLQGGSVVEHLARVTYYWPGNGGQVGTTTATGARAKAGHTIAVDPKIIPYGSVVTIPQLKKSYVAKDTGAAVKKKTASRRMGKNNIVVDVFCSSKAEALKLIKNHPPFMTIVVDNQK